MCTVVTWLDLSSVRNQPHTQFLKGKWQNETQLILQPVTLKTRPDVRFNSLEEGGKGKKKAFLFLLLNFIELSDSYENNTSSFE